MILLFFGMVGRVSDEDLVRRFKEGRRDAFSEIVRRYQDRVYGLCLRFLGDPPLAEEVAQDVFVALFRSLDAFRGDSLLSTWIFRVTLNHCRNKESYRRRRGHGRTDSIDAPVSDEEDAPLRQLADPVASTDAPLQAAQAERILHEALAALDEDHRQVLLLRDVEELSYEEIADILDLPRGTVKSRIHRARAELARRLGRRLDVADVV